MTVRSVPPPLLLAAALVLLEGLVAVIFGVAELTDLSSTRVAMGLTTAGFFLILGVALGLCSWGLRGLHSWARGPVLLAQLIGLGLAWNFRGGDTWGISVALAVPAVVVLVGMLHPATLDALDSPDSSSGDGS